MKVMFLSLVSVLFLAGCQTSSPSPSHSSTLITTSTPHSYGYNNRAVHGYGHGYGHGGGHGRGH